MTEDSPDQVDRDSIPGKSRANKSRRRKSFPATVPAAARKRYTRKRKRRLAKVENDLTAGQWAALIEAWSGCAYCQANSVALQRDCIMPVSRGGRYTLENVVPACASCNASKHNNEVTAWLRRKKLDERAFLLRHAEILRELRTRAGAAVDHEAPAELDDETAASSAPAHAPCSTSTLIQDPD